MMYADASDVNNIFFLTVIVCDFSKFEAICIHQIRYVIICLHIVWHVNDDYARLVDKWSV